MYHYPERRDSVSVSHAHQHPNSHQQANALNRRGGISLAVNEGIQVEASPTPFLRHQSFSIYKRQMDEMITYTNLDIDKLDFINNDFSGDGRNDTLSKRHITRNFMNKLTD
jgi:hypothetical protein